MSYILEALKKSDRDRQRQKVPDLHTVHETAPQKTARRTMWPWLLVMALFVNGAVVAALLLYLNHTEKPMTVAPPAAGPIETQTQTKPQAPASPAAIATASPAGSGSPAGDPSAAASQAGIPPTVNSGTRQETPIGLTQATPVPPSAKEPPPTAVAPPPAAGPVRPEAQPAPAQPPVSPPDIEEAEETSEETSTEADADQPGTNFGIIVEQEEGAADADLPADSLENTANSPQPPSSNPARAADRPQAAPEMPYLDKLPASFRASLPPLAISFHVYSQKQGSRLVSINGKLLREGQEVAEGLKLEEIIPEGVVLNYKGERFRMKVF